MAIPALRSHDEKTEIEFTIDTRYRLVRSRDVSMPGHERTKLSTETFSLHFAVSLTLVQLPNRTQSEVPRSPLR